MISFEYIEDQLLPPKKKKIAAIRKRNWVPVIAVVLLGLLAPIIANDVPVFRISDSGVDFPVFGGYYEQNTDDFEVWPLIAYAPGVSDRKNEFKNAGYKSPFGNQITRSGESLSVGKWHYLGTMKKGEDVAAGLIHGTRNAVFVGFGAAFFTAFIAMLIGGAAGYYHVRRFGLSWLDVVLLLVGIGLGYFYLFQVADFVGLGLFAGYVVLARWLSKQANFSSLFSVDLGGAIDRFIESFSAIPALLFLFALLGAGVVSGAVSTVIILIGCVGWVGMARIVRAEVIKSRTEGYVQAATALGLSPVRILFKHMVPNVFPAIMSLFVMSVAGAILAESTLSFLGLGVTDGVTWGQLLAAAKANIGAWWLSVFPIGLMAYFVYHLHRLTQVLTSANT